MSPKVYSGRSPCDERKLKRGGSNGTAPAEGVSIERSGLKRACAKEKLDDVAFVRLPPVELSRRHRTEIETIDVHRIEQAAPEGVVAGDGGRHQGRPNRFEHPGLGTIHYGDER